jgi:hypothetical protein
MLRRITLWCVAGLVLLSVASFGAVGWVGSERALHPEYHRYQWSLATFPDLDPEHIQIRSVDNVLLDGRFFRGAQSSLVILASGYGDTQDQMLSIAGEVMSMQTESASSAYPWAELLQSWRRRKTSGSARS